MKAQQIVYEGFAGPVARKISERLEAAAPLHYLGVLNESAMHCVPKDSETHFKVVVVSDTFEGMPVLQRHRMVNQALAEMLAENEFHALSVVAKTPQQWDRTQSVQPSPACLGGLKKES